MILCPRCQGANSDDAGECVWCGLPLPAAAGTGSRDERGAVTGDAGGAPAPGTLSAPTPDESWDADDPLAGLEGLLPPLPLPHTPEEKPVGASPEPTDEERRDADLFYRTATEPAPLEPPRLPPNPPSPPLISGGMRLLLGLLVLVAVLTPLITGGRLDAAMRPHPASAALTQSLAALEAGNRVLVAYDYAPSAAAELNPVSDSVLANLAARSVRLVALSTRPEGVDLARQSLEQLAAGDASLQSGEDVALLGYLAGDAAGLRLAVSNLPAALAHTGADGAALENLPVLQDAVGAIGLGDMDAILVLTDDANLARRWVEQVGARVPAPLVMVTSAAIEPLLVPYADSGQVAALVSGAYGGLSYASEEDRGHSLYSADGFAALWAVLAVASVWGVLRPARGRTPRR